MDYKDIITIEPGKRGGKPCVRGLRITVYEVLEYLASDMSEAEILDDFPDTTSVYYLVIHQKLFGFVSETVRHDKLKLCYVEILKQ